VILIQTLAIVIVAYTAFFAITITAIASLPPSMTGLAVPLGCVAAVVVLIAAYQLCAP
jgi:hypothetical protein